jgi:hypothetical protein
MPETSLYPAVKRFLEAASFDVKGEVKGCDIVAVRAGEGLTLTIVEMKLGVTLDLLLQVTDRMRAADEVGWQCRQPGEAATEIHACTVCAGSSALVLWRSVPRASGWKCWSSRALISQGGIIDDADSC